VFPKCCANDFCRECRELAQCFVFLASPARSEQHHRPSEKKEAIKTETKQRCAESPLALSLRPSSHRRLLRSPAPPAPSSVRNSGFLNLRCEALGCTASCNAPHPADPTSANRHRFCGRQGRTQGWPYAPPPIFPDVGNLLIYSINC
jgi:hypothetical protein